MDFGKFVDKLYSNLKFLRFSDQLDSWRNNSVVAPVHVRIKPINRCNHNCWYCAYRFKDLKLGEDMDLSDVIPKEKMFEIIDDLIDMGIKAVTFSGGGEPLIYPHITEAVNRLGLGVCDCLVFNASLEGTARELQRDLYKKSHAYRN